MIAPINAAKAVELLEAAVAAKGKDFIYDSQTDGCVYVKDGACSCLVGDALVRHGVPLDWFSTRMGEGSVVNGVSIRTLAVLDYLPCAISSSALRVFSVAQGVQDQGATWGDALERAKRVAVNPTYDDNIKDESSHA